jgi:hypothetical protein
LTTDTQSTQNIPTSNPTIEDTMTEVNHIKALFEQFIAAGGDPKVTAFKKHIDGLIKTDIKHLCSGSGKTANGSGSDWRREQKAMFAGRGAKWVQVALDVVNPSLDEFEEDGIDCSAYKAWTTQAGYAWVRYSGPRVDPKSKAHMAAFEVRTSGSKDDHQRQLLILPAVGLDDVISPLGGTPHSEKLEVIASPSEAKEPEAEETETTEVVDEVETPDDETPSDVPDSDDPEAWEAYLSSQGLSNDEFEDDYDDDLNDDIF